MTKTHTLIAKMLTGALMIGGIALCLSGTQKYLRAELTGGGSTIMDASSGDGTAIMAGDLRVHAAAPESNGAEIALGMLLFMLGFGLHALFTMKNERPVHVSSRRSHKGNDLRKEYLEFFWIQKL